MSTSGLLDLADGPLIPPFELVVLLRLVHELQADAVRHPPQVACKAEQRLACTLLVLFAVPKLNLARRDARMSVAVLSARNAVKVDQDTEPVRPGSVDGSTDTVPGAGKRLGMSFECCLGQDLAVETGEVIIADRQSDGVVAVVDNPFPVFLGDPRVPVSLEDTLCVAAIGDVELREQRMSATFTSPLYFAHIALARFRGLFEWSASNPSLRGEPCACDVYEPGSRWSARLNHSPKFTPRCLR